MNRRAGSGAIQMLFSTKKAEIARQDVKNPRNSCKTRVADIVPGLLVEENGDAVE
jgi:hypothetical protein